MKTRDLELRLAMEKARADRLEHEASKGRGAHHHLNGVRDEDTSPSSSSASATEEDEDVSDPNPRAILSNSGKKRILTIM